MSVTTTTIGTVQSVTTDHDGRRYALLALGDAADMLLIECTYAGDDVQEGTKARVTVAWGETQLPLPFGAAADRPDSGELSP